MLIDTHAHFDCEAFDPDREREAVRAAAGGVGMVVIPGYVAARWPALYQACDTVKALRCVPAPGLHPCYVEQHEDAHLTELEHWLDRGDAVAVGEIGLDYFVAELKAPELKERQEHFFRAQLRLAQSRQLPVILHVRKAHADVLRILREERFHNGGIVHAFSGGLEEARHYARHGFCLGIGGPLTYDQSKRLHAVVADMPLSALVLETDAPDMIPLPYRDPVLGGRTRNSPAYLPAVASALAACKGVPLSVLQAEMELNSRRVLRLPADA